MKSTYKFFNSFASAFDAMPKKYKILSTILTTILLLDISGVIPDSKHREKTPYDIQIEKVATIELTNGAKVVMSGFSLLDGDEDFETGDAVYIELTDHYLPSSVRHFYDVHEENGEMYAETKWSGSYRATLIEGKIIAMN